MKKHLLFAALAAAALLGPWAQGAQAAPVRESVDRSTVTIFEDSVLTVQQIRDIENMDGEFSNGTSIPERILTKADPQKVYDVFTEKPVQPDTGTEPKPGMGDAERICGALKLEDGSVSKKCECIYLDAGMDQYEMRKRIDEFLKGRVSCNPGHGS